MDELKIKSKGLRWVISKFASRFIKKKTGLNFKVNLEDLDISNANDDKKYVHLNIDLKDPDISVTDGTDKIHIEIEGHMTQEKFLKLLEKLDL